MVWRCLLRHNLRSTTRSTPLTNFAKYTTALAVGLCLYSLTGSFSGEISDSRQLNWTEDGLVNGYDAYDSESIDLLDKSSHNQSCYKECKRLADLRTLVNCSAIVKGNKTSIMKSVVKNQISKLLTEIEIYNITLNCDSFRQSYFYPSKARSKEEASFPIAYSIVVHKDPVQVEKLLRAIYWPQNYYCIHVDKKGSKLLNDMVVNLARCLPNVMMASEQERIIYGHFSRLQADFTCMKDLLRSSKKWKYLINLTGQEYPLKTNGEIVEILKIYNGANDIESLSQTTLLQFSQRFTSHWRISSGKLIKNSKEPKKPPPNNITLVKGSAFGVFSRRFMEFVFSKATTALLRDFVDWLQDTWSPDELFWATVNSQYYNPSGGYNRDPTDKLWLAKYVAWPPRDSCAGKKVHWICVFASADLASLVTRKELFANKFDIKFDPVALDCLEDWLHSRTFYHSGKPMNYDFYKNLSFVIKT